jgi:heat shock protein HslJ
MFRYLLPALLLLPACRADETLSGYGAAGQVWELRQLDGIPFSATATITFPEAGQIAGQAPCNRYSGQQSAPYPWFEVRGVAATRMACPDLALESAFFEALAAMTLSEISGPVMILSNTEGREMLFRARAAD